MLSYPDDQRSEHSFTLASQQSDSYQWTAEGGITVGVSCRFAIPPGAMTILRVLWIVLPIQEPSTLWGSWLVVKDDILLWFRLLKDSKTDGCKSQTASWYRVSAFDLNTSEMLVKGFS